MVKIVDGEYSNGIGFVDPTDDIVHELSFEPKEFDYTVPTELMFADCNGIILKFDYANEYDNEMFTITVNGRQFKGVFQVCESYSNPVVLTAV